MSFLALLEACKRGDPAALQSFIEKFHPIVYKIIRKRVLSPSEIEDVEQDFFLKFIERNLFVKFRGNTEDELGAYLVRIAINHTNEYLRKHLKRKSTHEITEGFEALESHFQTGADTSPDKLLIESEFQEALDSAIGKLPANYKSIVKLRLLNYANREIAEVLEIPKGTVDVYLSRAMNMLSKDLKDWRQGK